MRLTPLQHSFAGGELSPKVAGRSDLAIYATAAARMRNLIPLPQGPVLRRSGTRYVNGAKSNSAQSRLIPFVFGIEQSYVLEFSDLKVRIYTDEGYITAPTNTWPFTNVDTAAETITIDDVNTHGYSNGQGPFRLVDVGGLPNPLNNATDYYIITIAGSPRVFQLSLTSGGAPINLTTTGGAGNSIIPKPATTLLAEFDSPYTAAQIPNVSYVQSSDIMILVHPDRWPQALSRYANDRWVIANYETDGPYLDVLEITPTIMVATGTTMTTGGGYNVVGAAMTLVSSNPAFLAGRDEGRILWAQAAASAADEGIFRITSVTSSTTANGITLRASVTGLAPIGLWHMGAWYVANYPRAVTFFQQRLVYGGQSQYPQRIDLSATGDFIRFPIFETLTYAPGVVTDPNFPFNFVVASDQVNAILWLRQGRTLLMGTADGIYPLQASSLNEAITGTNANTFRSSASGATTIRPEVVGDRILYVGDNERKLFESTFDINADSFVSVELSLLADHLLIPGVIETAYANSPHSILHILTEDGKLCGFTRVQDQEVRGFHLHTLGGGFGLRTFAAGAVDTANDRITLANHGYENLFGPVQFTNSGGALPTGISALTNYWIKVFDANTIELLRWPNASATKIDITAAGSGTHTLTPVSNYARIESICSIRSEDLSYDQVWMVVKRTINGATVRYIEFFEQDFDFLREEDFADAFMVDCGLSLRQNTAGTAISGLGHLEGQPVAVLADGLSVTGLTVSAGAITLAVAARQVHVGLAYTSTLETMKLDIALRQGGMAGKMKKIDHVVFRATRSLPVQAGFDDTALETFSMRTPENEASAAPPPFTGDYRGFIGPGWDRTRRVVVQTSEPLPLLLNSLALEADVETLGGNASL